MPVNWISLFSTFHEEEEEEGVTKRDQEHGQLNQWQAKDHNVVVQQSSGSDLVTK